MEELQRWNATDQLERTPLYIEHKSGKSYWTMFDVPLTGYGETHRCWNDNPKSKHKWFSQQKRHWVEKRDSDGSTYYECSACHGEIGTAVGMTPLSNGFVYCPYCGSRMERRIYREGKNER